MLSNSILKFNVGNTLQHINSSKEELIDVPLSKDFQLINQCFIGHINGTWYAYDNICDHNGGTLKLDLNGKTATCPMHKWTLNLSKGEYENGCRKKNLDIKFEKEKLLITRKIKSFPDLDTLKLADSKMHFNFNAHASLSINIDDLNFISDPWFIGPSFTTGWWHKYPPSEEALSRLLNSQLIYISHNHPDHLHIPTLKKYVSKDKIFLIPNFKSKSVEKILRASGYNNLIVANFLQEIFISTINGEVLFMLVKSGDDRDDSSLIISTKQNKIFLGVDTNMPNNWILPSVDILFTSFASGASGFPTRVENFTTEKINEIIKINRNSILNNYVSKLIEATKPKYVVPYAGYFTESYLDSDVTSLNKKNSENEFITFINQKYRDIQALNPIKNTSFELFASSLKTHDINETPLYFIDNEYFTEHIQDFKLSPSKNSKKVNLEKIGNFFIKSKFTDELTIIIILCDDNFNAFNELSLNIDFSPNARNFKLIDLFGLTNEFIINQERLISKNKIEILRVRKDILFAAASKGLPLEDLSIGFQIKMFRMPNIYNFSFWNHFTNNELFNLS
jgi:CMP-N-acetylneuraminate monooxygenase